MKHDLCLDVLVVVRVTLAPIVRDGVCKNGAAAVERGRGDGSTNLRVALETVLGILVPEVKGTVSSSSAKGSVDRVERNVVDRVDLANITSIALCYAVALERKVGAIGRSADGQSESGVYEVTYEVSFSST